MAKPLPIEEIAPIWQMALDARCNKPIMPKCPTCGEKLTHPVRAVVVFYPKGSQIEGYVTEDDAIMVRLYQTSHGDCPCWQAFSLYFGPVHGQIEDERVVIGILALKTKSLFQSLKDCMKEGNSSSV